MNDIGFRLNKLIEDKGLTPYSVSIKTGVSQSTLSRILNKNSKPNESNMKALIEFFNVSETWLLTGREDYILNDDQKNFLNEETSKQYGTPYYDIDFTASFLEVENSQKAVPDSYITHPFFKGCDYVVRASGQSMAKVIKHGDAIGLIEIKNWREFLQLGEIYAIVTDEYRMIKVITRGDDKDMFTLISKPSDGKVDEFPPQQLPKKLIRSIYKVQASSHLF